ncbi:MAG: XdhC family protein [Gammaproteobacteria bacterium]
MRSEILSALIEAKKAKVPIALLTELGNGRQWVVGTATLPDADGIDPDAIARGRTLLAEDRSECFESVSGPIFIQVFNPPFRLILVGAVHIAQPLAQLADLAAYDTLVIDPRAAFAEIERFAGLSVDRRWPDEALSQVQGDPRTALVTLTHDPKLDDPALDWALRTPAFYIGALGSRKTHESRLQRLAGRGFSVADGARIHGPVGLSIGAVTPAEIAISIMAQITQTRHAKASERWT